MVVSQILFAALQVEGRAFQQVSPVRGTAGRAFHQVTPVRGTAGRAFQQEDHVQQALGLPHKHYPFVPPAAHSAQGTSSRKGSWSAARSRVRDKLTSLTCYAVLAADYPAAELSMEMHQESGKLGQRYQRKRS